MDQVDLAQCKVTSYLIGWGMHTAACHVTSFKPFPVSFNAFLSHVIRYHRCVVHPSLLILTHNIL